MHVAIAGNIGAGKTTLLRILARLEEADSGNVILPTSLTVGYLPQDGLAHSGRTLFEETSTAFQHLLDIKTEMHKIEHELGNVSSLKFEYDAMLNDNKGKYDHEDLSFGKGIGYLNAGLRWSVSENLLLELNFNDIRRNQDISETAHREFKILYSKKF